MATSRTTKKSKNKNSGKGRRAIQRKMITFSGVLICMWLVFTIINIQIDLHREKQILADLQDQVALQKIENDELARILINGGDAEYIERIAREKLGYVAPDEVIIVDTPQTGEPEPEVEPETTN